MQETPQKNAEEVVLEAILGLPPRYRYLIWLDLVALLPPDEIQAKLRLSSPRAFHRLKFAAFLALHRLLEGKD
jgi:DNA-directed RNA polymerase specialized sigma24 family protein